MKCFMMSVPEKMLKALEQERKLRRLESIQETVRQLLSDYFKKIVPSDWIVIPLGNPIQLKPGDPLPEELIRKLYEAVVEKQ